MRKDSPETSCCPKGGEEVQKILKDKLSKLGIKLEFRANKAGCLDACASGVAMVIYPSQTWYGGVTVADVDEIIERSILKDEVIERLSIK